MSLIPFYLPRVVAIQKIPEAIARGLTVSGFIRELKAAGLSYRRTLMLADWRSAANIEARKDVIKYVRRDRYPTAKEYAETEWPWREEWAYKLRVRTILLPGKSITEHFVIIESDKPLTCAEMEQQVYSRWGEWEHYEPELLTGVQRVAAYHRMPSPLEE